MEGSRPLLAEGRPASRLDGDNRTPPRNRPIAQASRARERYGKGLVQQPGNLRGEAYDPFVLNDLHHFLEKCIRALPRLQREAVKLAFFEGLSHREIAATTHAPLGTVKTRLELGLRKLAHSIRPLRGKV